MKKQLLDHNHSDLISVEDTLATILKTIPVLGIEEKPAHEAMGQVLAENIVGIFDIPTVNNSAMDGYAVQSKSIKNASKSSPVKLKIVGAVSAGQISSQKVTKSTTIRIMTGAPIPSGADAVVPFEDTDEKLNKTNDSTSNEIGIRVSVPESTNIRYAGRDIRTGEIVLHKGSVLRPADIGIIASLGIKSAKVVQRPQIAVLATGNELLQPDENHEAGRIYDSNSYSLASAITSAGGIPNMLGIAKDNADSLLKKLHEGVTKDLLITSAGVSKGDYDLVKDVLVKNGTIKLWSVKMRPAKPIAFGIFNGPNGGKTPLLGLPGNPVSTLVGFEQFGRPAILKMMGKTNLQRPTVNAILETPIHNHDGRRVYARVVVIKRNKKYYARITGKQDSNLLTSMSKANGLAICPENVAKKEVGDSVVVQMIDWQENVF